eukprot:TRINITY_DN5417_c0_g1_i1.p1 TRINITY_DN5417_c0_g1~~TRINITY_DN5417_c0_g1_i1.p1  ORF type:complete len:455 (+),score=85.89 TRINITY_DN5417_c0_g1_i1:75-1439(+)
MSASVRPREDGKSRSADRGGNRDRRQPKKRDVTEDMDTSQEGQGNGLQSSEALPFRVDVQGDAGVSAEVVDGVPGSRTPTGAGTTALEVSDGEEEEDDASFANFSDSDPEIISKMVETNAGLAEAPGYYKAGLFMQISQSKRDIKSVVTRSHRAINTKINKVKSELKAEINHTNMEVQKIAAAQAASAKEVEDVRKELHNAIERLTKLEQAARAGSSSGSTAPPSSDAGTSHPTYVPYVASEAIDRARYYGGSYEDMPKAAVEKQLHKLVKDFNDDPNWGGNGHLIIDSMFVPITCSCFWIKFKSSLGATSSDQGRRFKAYIDTIRVVCVRGDKAMWLQPNRTEGERSQRRIVTIFLSFLHRIREELGLGRTYTKAGHTGAILLRGNFKPGLEKALWKGQAVAGGTNGEGKMTVVTDEALTKIFDSEYRAKGKTFSVQRFRADWDEYFERSSHR